MSISAMMMFDDLPDDDLAFRKKRRLYVKIYSITISFLKQFQPQPTTSGYPLFQQHFSVHILEIRRYGNGIYTTTKRMHIIL
jgi:hypothetical protein